MRFGPKQPSSSTSYQPILVSSSPPPQPSSSPPPTSTIPQQQLATTTTSLNSIIKQKGKSSSSSKQQKKLLKSRSKIKQQKLVLQPARGDGNCLFRSVSYQIYGDENWHDRVREECLDFMARDATHFREFVDGDFQEYIALKRKNGCFGDNPEIQAMAELYNRPVIVYTTDIEENEENEEEDDHEDCLIHIDGHPRHVKKLNIFHNKYYDEEPGAAPIRLCYRGKSHYDAVVDPNSATVGVGLGFAGFEPGKADRDLMKSATWATDIEATERELERIALAASLEDAFTKKQSYLKSSSTKKRRKLNPQPATTTSSSSSSSSSSSLPELVESQDFSLSMHSPAVRELVLNGFPLEKVLVVNAIAGDSFDDMLALLVSSV